MNRFALSAVVLLFVALVALGARFLLSEDTRGSAEVGALEAAETASEAPQVAELASPEGAPESEGEAPRLALSEPADGGIRPVASDDDDDGAPSGRVSGRVLDRLGSPVAGAEVELRRAFSGIFGAGDAVEAMFAESPRQATTDAQGRFEITSPLGEFDLGVQADGYAPFVRNGLRVADGGAKVDDVTLSAGARLAGRVVDSYGNGIEGARLSPTERVRFGMSGAREAVAVTDASGRFDVTRLACGPWRIEVDHPEYPSERFEGRADVPGELIGDLVFELEAGRSIRGQVFDLPEDLDRRELFVTAARVDASNGVQLFDALNQTRSAMLDEDNAFELRGLRAGERYRVQLRQRQEIDGGRVAFQLGATLSDGVLATPGDNGVRLIYQPEGALLLQVVDAETGEPVEDYDLRAGVGFVGNVIGGAREQNGHPEGRARVGDLRPGSGDRARLTIEAIGYRTYERDDIEVIPGQEVDLGVIALEPMPVVRVRVRDDQGRPLEGALVSLSVQRPSMPDFSPDGEGGGTQRREMRFEVNAERGGDDDDSGDLADRLGGLLGDANQAETDADGLAVVSSFEGELCQLVVRAPGFAEARKSDLRLPEGRPYDVEIELDRGGTLEVLVLNPDGEPQAGVEVRHKRPGEARDTQVFSTAMRRERSDGEGRIVLRNEPRGVHAFQIVDPNDRPGGMFESGGGQIVIAGVGGGGGEWDEVELTSAGDAQIVLRTAAVGALVGRITEAGQLLAGARLELKDEASQNNPLAGLMGSGGPNARTDGEGKYEFTGVKEGRYTLEITHPERRMPSSFEIEIEPGQERFDVDLPLAVLSGRLVDEDGQPIAGARVWAERQTGSRTTARRIMMVTDNGGGGAVSMDDGSGDRATTDDDGNWTLRGVAVDVELVVRIEGDAIQPLRSDPIEVMADETIDDLDMVGEPAGMLRVRAINQDGSPASFLMVVAEPEEEGVESKREIIAQGGEVLIRGMKPGSWSVSVSPLQGIGGGGEGAPAQGAQIVREQTAELTFEL